MEESGGPGIDWRFSKKDKKLPGPSVSHPDAEVYKKHLKRGTALILNHKNFDFPDCSPRIGTEKDGSDLEQLLNALDFDVITRNDLTYAEIIVVLDEVAKKDHSEYGCLIVAVMTHGESGILYARDTTYKPSKLWTLFSPLNCPSLAGKPKLFFIQACRGEKTDPGYVLGYTETDSDNRGKEYSYSIPVTADFLIMYATVEGYYAWRSQEGSYFIQALVNQIRKRHSSEDFLSILTCVNREVAINFESWEPKHPHFDKKKEMCSIVSMLTRKFYVN